MYGAGAAAAPFAPTPSSGSSTSWNAQKNNVLRIVGLMLAAINTSANLLSARTLGASGLHPSHGEAFFPGLIEEQSEAFRDGVSIGRDFDGGG